MSLYGFNNTSEIKIQYKIPDTTTLAPLVLWVWGGTNCLGDQWQNIQENGPRF